MKRITFLTCLAAVFLIMLTGSSYGQIGENVASYIFPELKTMGAPAWAKEGLRLTYTSSQANMVLQSFSSDPSTASGGGYTQVEIAAIDGRHAVLNVRCWGLASPKGPVIPVGNTSVVEAASAPGNWWINPAIFRSLPAEKKYAYQVPDENGRIVAEGEVISTRISYPIGSKAVSAYRFQSRGVRYVGYKENYADILNEKTDWTFSTDTGIMLHCSTDSETYASQAKRKLSGESTFLGVRQVSYPWSGGQVPSWIGAVQSLGYSGTITMALPGNPPGVQATSITDQVTARGSNWLQYRQTEVRQNLPGIPPYQDIRSLVAGPGMPGALFVPPGPCKGLSAGYALDSDPLTGTKFSVASNDGKAITLKEVGQTHFIEATYDLGTGTLVKLRAGGRDGKLIIQAALISVK